MNKIRLEHLPVFIYTGGKWELCPPVACYVYGEMSDGCKVWANENDGKQYTKQKIGSKYYFVEL